MPDIRPAIDAILAAHGRTPAHRATLVAVSGIDGCGKGHVAARLDEALRRRGLRVAAINLDGWLNLPPVRFGGPDPGAHFYRHAIRFEEMFRRLILPLRERRTIRLEAALVEETATAYHRHTYDFDDVDVIIVEGIFLLRRELVAHYDVSIWIECEFETALARAVARGQEGLPADETVTAYRTIYFPAQEIHLAADDPRTAATLVLDNEALDEPPGAVA